TDKVVLELPSPSAGVITEIRKGDGATVVAGEVIAVLDTDAKAGAAAPAAQPAAAPAPAAQPAAAPAPAAQPPSAPAPQPAAAPGPAGRLMATPSAATTLAEKGREPSRVAGAGFDGRVTKGDALAATPGAKAGASV